MAWANGAALAFRRALWRFTLGIEARRRGRLARVTMFLYTALVLSGGMEAQARPTRRVLILNETGTSYPAINTIDQGIRAGLQDAPYRLEFYREYMETVLFPDPKTQQEFRDFYLRKYQNRKPDVIITVGPSPLQFMLETHERAFAGVPVIFCLPYGPLPGTLTLDAGITGVENVVEPAATLEVALRLKPKTKHVIIVGGTSTLDRQTEAMVQQGLRSYAGRLDISYLTNLTMPALLKRLRHLPSDAIILFSGITQDAAGTPFLGSESAPAVTAAASAPVFVLTDSFLGHGEVGGKLFVRFEQGQVTGNMSLRVLNGEKPQDIPVVSGVTQYMFDWRALKRWGMKESNLPPGSIVLNRQPGFWQLYKQYALVGIFVFLTQAVAILGLLRQRRRRRKAEVELRRSEEKFSRSFRQSPLAISITSTNDDRYLEVNEAFEQLTGWRRDEVAGRNPLEINLWLNPDYRFAFVKQLLAQSNVRDLEAKIRRKDGQIRTTLDSAELIEVEGEPCVLSVFTDITERKQAEEALSSVSRRLIEAQEHERTRIARELHDDINQRIAMLAVDLDQLQQTAPGSSLEIRNRMNGPLQRLSEIGIEIQAISHRLHSSKLEYLGLVTACKSFCREVGDRHKVTVDFAAEDIPPAVPQDVSLCLFRILQESLNNAIKHSGMRHFEVHLGSISGQIQLTVRDSGIGFDADAAMSSLGLGLISMRERVSLVKGTMLIASKPMGGTEISVRVPVISAKGASEAIFGAA